MFRISFFSYLFYALVFGIFIFRIHTPTLTLDRDNFVANQILHAQNDKGEIDQVVLLEDGLLALQARMDLFRQAKHTIDLAYHTIHEGDAADLFFHLLFEAAERGVQVNLLLDGMFHNLRGNLKKVYYALVDHPNIELKFYEPFNLLKPWTWQNRLHDKIMIVDGTYAVIGGRNIGDKYFFSESSKNYVHDRDLLMIGDASTAKSVLYDLDSYFETLWNHLYTKVAKDNISKRKSNLGKEKMRNLQQTFEQKQKTSNFVFRPMAEWCKEAIPVSQIEFIHNPIERLNKEPWILMEINELLGCAKKDIYIESPYVIPTRRMESFLSDLSIPSHNVTVLTNSLLSTPNPLAFSGYLRNVEEMIERGLNIIEYIHETPIHSKTFVIDDDITIIGSFNLDARSSFLSTESMVIVKDETFAQTVKENIEYRIKNSEEFGKKTKNQSFSIVAKKIFLKLLSQVTRFYQHLLSIWNMI